VYSPTQALRTRTKHTPKQKKELSKGGDPGEKDQIKKAAHREAFTIKALIDEYMKRHAKPIKVTWREDLRCLNREVIPTLGKRKAKEIRKRDIIRIIDRITDRGSPAMANRVHSVLSKLFKFAVIRDILDTSPYAFVPSPAARGVRDRALDNAEIKIFWDGLDNSDMEPQFQLALKFLLTTAQRRSEVVKAEWREFDLKKGEWGIPIERLKSRKRKNQELVGPHIVPLSDLAISLLREIKLLSNGSRFLFPSKQKAGQYTAPATVTRALWQLMDKNNEDRIKVNYFTVHDLRRSATTAMISIGISEFIAGKILNHAAVGITGKVYNRYDHLKEKTEALGQWGRKLQSIITGQKAKIVSIHK